MWADSVFRFCYYIVLYLVLDFHMADYTAVPRMGVKRCLKWVMSLMCFIKF